MGYIYVEYEMLVIGINIAIADKSHNIGVSQLVTHKIIFELFLGTTNQYQLLVEFPVCLFCRKTTQTLLHFCYLQHYKSYKEHYLCFLIFLC